MLAALHAFRQANGFYTDEYRRYAKACRAEVILRRKACTDPLGTRGKNGRLSHFGKGDLEALLASLAARGGEGAGTGAPPPAEAGAPETAEPGAAGAGPDAPAAAPEERGAAPGAACYFRPSMDLLLFVLFQAEKAYAIALSIRDFISTDSEKLRGLPFGKLARGMLRHLRRAAERAKMAERLYAALPAALGRPEDARALRELYSPQTVDATVSELRLYSSCVCAALSQQQDDYVETLRDLQLAGLLALRLARAAPGAAPDAASRGGPGLRSLEVLLGEAEPGDALSLGPDGEPAEPATGIPALDAFLNLFARPLENSRSTVLAFMGPSQANRRALQEDLAARCSAELRACEEASQDILARLRDIDAGAWEGGPGPQSAFSYSTLRGAARVLLPEGAVRRALSGLTGRGALPAAQADVAGALRALGEVYAGVERELAAAPAGAWEAGLHEFLGFRPPAARFRPAEFDSGALGAHYKVVSTYLSAVSGISRVVSDFSERPAPREAARLKGLAGELSADLREVRTLHAYCMLRHYALHLLNPGAFKVSGTPLQEGPDKVICAVLEALAPSVLSRPPVSLTPKTLAAVLNSDAVRGEILGRVGAEGEGPALLFVSLCRLLYCASGARHAASFASASVSAPFYAKPRGTLRIEYPGAQARVAPGDPAADAPAAPSEPAEDFSPAHALDTMMEAATVEYSAAETLTEAFSPLFERRERLLRDAALSFPPFGRGPEAQALAPPEERRAAAALVVRLDAALYPLAQIAARGLAKPAEDASAPPPCLPAFTFSLDLGDAVPGLLSWEYVFQAEDAEPRPARRAEAEVVEEAPSRGAQGAPGASDAVEPAEAGAAPEAPASPKPDAAEPVGPAEPAVPSEPAEPAGPSEPAEPTEPAQASPQPRGIMSRLASLFRFGSK